MAKATAKRPKRSAAVRSTTSKPKQSTGVIQNNRWLVVAVALLLLIGGVFYYTSVRTTVTYENPDEIQDLAEELDCDPPITNGTIEVVPGCEDVIAANTGAVCDATVPGNDCSEAAILGASVSTVRPAAKFSRTSFRGVTLDLYTVVLQKRAESYMRASGAPVPRMVQGSFRPASKNSASTHSGGGALDVSIRAYSSGTQLKILKAYRKAGFAAWIRTPADGFTTHLHAIAICDTKAHSQAKAQVRDYFKHKNGLASHKKDRYASSVGYPIPAWAKKCPH